MITPEYVRTLWITEFNKHLSQKLNKNTKYNSSKKWDGGRDAYGRNHKPIWPKIAELINKQSLDPVAYIRSVFKNHLHYSPTPNLLLSAKTLANFIEYRPQIREQLIISLRTQTKAAQLSFVKAMDIYNNQKQAWTAVLCSKNISLTPLFRYTIAVKEQLPSMISRWKIEAELQYKSNINFYNEIWGSLLPLDITEVYDG